MATKNEDKRAVGSAAMLFWHDRQDCMAQQDPFVLFARVGWVDLLRDKTVLRGPKVSK